MSENRQELKKSERTILFGTGVDNAGLGVREFGKLDTIFLANECLVVPAFAHIVKVDGFVRRRSHQQRAFVVVVH